MPTTHTRRDNPTCPYCDHEHEDWNDIVYRDYYYTEPQNGESHDLTCPACRMRYLVRVQVEEFYTSRPLPARDLGGEG